MYTPWTTVEEISLIQSVMIDGFKSIEHLELDLGRVNVFIGESGGGKSNLLEGVAIGAAAVAGMLSNEYLAARGIRATGAEFMNPAFPGASWGMTFSIKDASLPLLTQKIDFGPPFRTYTANLNSEVDSRRAANLVSDPLGIEVILASIGACLNYQRLIGLFVVYSPENCSLRTLVPEGQILPLGVKGEGLFEHIERLSTLPEGRVVLRAIHEHLALIDGFERFEIPQNLVFGEHRLRIRDRYLTEGVMHDQRSVGEGFLLLLFYLTLFLSPETPRFFAVDNVDAGLSPRLCKQLAATLVKIARDEDKQVMLTSHNPALLEGLDLHDDEQRLFVVERDGEGKTRARRVGHTLEVSHDGC